MSYVLTKVYITIPLRGKSKPTYMASLCAYSVCCIARRLIRILQLSKRLSAQMGAGGGETDLGTTYTTGWGHLVYLTVMYIMEFLSFAESPK